MAALKPAYLICGDDDAKIDAWRARVRSRAEAEAGPGALELFDARRDTPADVAAASTALTFDTGPRYLLVDDAGAWKAADLDPLERELPRLGEDTVLVLVARGKRPAPLAKAVERAGGEVREYAAPRTRELPGWVAERAREQGLQLDAGAARSLVALAGPRPARLVRELEKLALAAHPRTSLGVDDVEQAVAGEGSAGAYDLADALVAGDGRRALALAEELVAREGRAGGLAWPIVRRLREVHRVALLIDRGAGEKQAAAALRAPPWAVKRTMAQARRASREGLERALCAFADLELTTRGGGEAPVDETTAFTLALARATR